MFSRLIVRVAMRNSETKGGSGGFRFQGLGLLFQGFRGVFSWGSPFGFSLGFQECVPVFRCWGGSDVSGGFRYGMLELWPLSETRNLKSRT